MNTETNSTDSLCDVDGHQIEIQPAGSTIALYGWTIHETSVGMPFEHRADTLYLTRRQAVELARRLFIAATE